MVLETLGTVSPNPSPDPNQAPWKPGTIFHVSPLYLPDISLRSPKYLPQPGAMEALQTTDSVKAIYGGSDWEVLTSPSPSPSPNPST